MASPEDRQRTLLLDALLLGVAGALGAQLFLLLIRGVEFVALQVIAGYHPPGLVNDGGDPVEHVGRFGLWLVPLATTLGGLIVGWLTTRYAPEAEGHGTDAAIKAFHRDDAVVAPRLTLVKLVASAVTIGSGGSAGREGPAALIVGGLGSAYARITRRDPAERRMLLLMGMAAGLAAIFRSPIGTALFAVEVLYSEMEFESGPLIYALLASIVAYAVNGLFAGFEPLFRIPSVDAPRLADFGWYAILGVTAGLVASLQPFQFYAFRDGFRRLRLPAALKPALGGLLMGALALAVPQSIGGGYGWMQAAIDGRMLAGTMLLLVFAKMVATSLSVGSGGSGGLFAPSLYVGTMLGGLFAAVLHQPAAPFAIVGMGAVFAGAARVPVASLLMVTEMTGGYTLLVPAALALAVSYVVQTRLTRGVRHRSLYEQQVPVRSDSPTHHAEHLEIALRILEQKKMAGPLEPDHVALLAQLRSGAPAALGDGRRLLVGVLKPGSSWVGRSCAPNAALYGDTTLVTIIRGERMMAPRPDVTLQAGDRLILLTTEQGVTALGSHVDRW